jgi:hypothetical protein
MTLEDRLLRLRHRLTAAHALLNIAIGEDDWESVATAEEHLGEALKQLAEVADAAVTNSGRADTTEN